MAIQTGNIKYRGSFKSIRQYMNLHDPLSYAGEKGGANRDLIMNNPAFARTRENMSEFAGCGEAVKSIRRGLQNLLPEQTDKHFTARLMGIVKAVNRNDFEGVRGKRAIIFSGDRPLLSTFKLNILQQSADKMKEQFICLHPVSRVEATLSLTDFNIKGVYVPKGATFYRVQNHLSIISDFTYNEANRRYEPVSLMDGKSAFEYSEYTPVGTLLTDEIKAIFPVGTTLTEEVSVIQCVGIEFYVKSGLTAYVPLTGSSMLVADVF